MASEMSLGQLEKEHRKKMEGLRQQTEAQFKMTCQQGEAAAAALVADANAECRALHEGERLLEQRVKDVVAQTHAFHGRVKEWGELFGKFNGALKELGDVGHWSAVVEADVQDTVVVLEAVTKAKRQVAGMD
jgi:hypothetical protein